MKRVSDEDLDEMTRVLEREGNGRGDNGELAQKFYELHAELLALRKVADAAIGISVSMSAHTGGRWNTLRTAIHEAGL